MIIIINDDQKEVIKDIVLVVNNSNDGGNFRVWNLLLKYPLTFQLHPSTYID